MKFFDLYKSDIEHYLSKNPPLIELKSAGIAVDLFVKITEKLSKINPKLTTEDLQNIVVLENMKYEGSDFLNVQLKKTKEHSMQGLILDSFKIADLKMDNETLYVAIFNNKISLSKNKENLTMALENFLNGQGVAQEDKKAFDWLNGKTVGMSSLTLCYNMFPGLIGKHNEMNEYKQLCTPRDLSDFRRCEIFLEATNKSSGDIEKLNLSETWNALAKNWNQISELIKEKKNEDAYSLLKESLNAPPKVKVKP